MRSFSSFIFSRAKLFSVLTRQKLAPLISKVRYIYIYKCVCAFTISWFLIYFLWLIRHDILENCAKTTKGLFCSNFYFFRYPLYILLKSLQRNFFEALCLRIVGWCDKRNSAQKDGNEELFFLLFNLIHDEVNYIRIFQT